MALKCGGSGKRKKKMTSKFSGLENLCIPRGKHNCTTALGAK